MTSALTHFRERSLESLLIADFCSCSSGSMHDRKTMANSRTNTYTLATGANSRVAASQTLTGLRLHRRLRS